MQDQDQCPALSLLRAAPFQPTASEATGISIKDCTLVTGRCRLESRCPLDGGTSHRVSLTAHGTHLPPTTTNLIHGNGVSNGNTEAAALCWPSRNNIESKSERKEQAASREIIIIITHHHVIRRKKRRKLRPIKRRRSTSMPLCY